LDDLKRTIAVKDGVHRKKIEFT